MTAAHVEADLFHAMVGRAGGVRMSMWLPSGGILTSGDLVTVDVFPLRDGGYTMCGDDGELFELASKCAPEDLAWLVEHGAHWLIVNDYRNVEFA